MKNKVLIVSCYEHKNYGSMLQAYATQEYVERLGYHAVNVNVSGISKDLTKKKLEYYIKKANKLEAVKTKGKMALKLLRRKLNKEFDRNQQVRDKAFEVFEKERFTVTPLMHSLQEVSQMSKEYDTVLVGSDQMWLPHNIYAGFNSLAFVPDDMNKVAYATSFGVSNMPSNMYDEVRDSIGKIQHISVREDSGKRIVKEILDRDVRVVLDPTLLFDKEDWDGFIEKKEVVSPGYIFVYLLGNNKEHREYARQLSKLTGYRIVTIPHLDEYVKADEGYADEQIFNVGPVEFINLIRNAEYIITDSFHGTIFSTFYRKRYITLNRYLATSSMSTNSRLDTLFQLFGLQERYVKAPKTVEELKNILDFESDFEKCFDNIKERRKDSVAFLESALKG